MTCDPELLKLVPLFSLLDADEREVLASHVEVRRFGGGQPKPSRLCISHRRVKVAFLNSPSRSETRVASLPACKHAGTTAIAPNGKSVV